MSGAGCSHDCNTCSITLRACSLSPGLFLLHRHRFIREGETGSRVLVGKGEPLFLWLSLENSIYSTGGKGCVTVCSVCSVCSLGFLSTMTEFNHSVIFNNKLTNKDLR